MTIGLDRARALQNAAQNAVNTTTGKKAMIVADQTRRLWRDLAVAQRAAADADGPHSHHGAVPARLDVQDLVTAGAAIERDATRRTACWVAPARAGDRAPDRDQLRRVRPRDRADVAGVRQLVQHHVHAGSSPAKCRRAYLPRRPPHSTASAPLPGPGNSTVTGSVRPR